MRTMTLRFSKCLHGSTNQRLSEKGNKGDMESLRIDDFLLALNSTKYGNCFSKTAFSYEFRQGGIHVSDDLKRINLYKYIVWMLKRCQDWDARLLTSMKNSNSASNRYHAEKSLAHRELGELPEVVDEERKEKCRKDFKLFCESYFPNSFYLKWSEDHLKVIAKIEMAVLEGGLFAVAMPRGSGKTGLAITAAIWAMLYGHRKFIVLIGANETAAVEMLETIKSEIEFNELLMEDFPAACYPVKALDGVHNRCGGQLYHGDRTLISWTANEVVLPTIKGAESSGIVVRVAGITGRIRGMNFKRPDGASVRPNLVIVDDPQTAESATSLEQTRKRIRILSGDILGLAGPGEKISGIMPCTIIRSGDMADTILDREKFPDWNGEKTKMVYKFPDNLDLWTKYGEIRAESLREKGNISEATEFYRQHKEEMDAGSEIAWSERYNQDELSALQHAMNLKFRDNVAFESEYQNEPLAIDLGTSDLLSIDELAGKVNGIPVGKIPLGGEHVTAFVDVQKALLFYTVVAWSDDFTGYVIEYGTFPRQKHLDFSLSNANPTIQTVFPQEGFESALFKSLENLMNDILNREWEREDGAILRIKRALIDANWGLSTNLIYEFCKQAQYNAVVSPSHGKFIGASSKPMTEYTKKPGDKIGFNWMMPNVIGKRIVRYVLFDANFWKSFVHARLNIPVHECGSLSFYGKNPEKHKLIASHLRAEYPVRTMGRGRCVDEWKIRADHADNHWFDCIVGCAVCASMEGCSLPEFVDMFKKQKTKNKSIKLSELAAYNGSTGKIRLSDIQRQKMALK